jgi:hypothetical protein
MQQRYSVNAITDILRAAASGLPPLAATSTRQNCCLKGAKPMLQSIKTNQTIEEVLELYVVVFPVQMPSENRMVETILAGFQKDPDEPGQILVRATVETHISAVPDLVEMCDQIIGQKEELSSYRLLKFDSKGIHELNPADFRDIDRVSFVDHRGSLWGAC